MKLRKFLTSDFALLLSLAATLALMGRHIYHVYNGGAWGIAAAFGLAAATMQAILRGHKRMALGFALLDVLYNLSYFKLLAPTLQGSIDPARADAYLLSIAAAVAIAFYAHEYAHRGTSTAQPAIVLPLFNAPPLRFPARSAIPRATLPAPAAPALPDYLQEQAEPAENAGCHFDGCPRPAEPCPGCGKLRCKAHGGAHGKHHCAKALVQLNGHYQEE